MTNNEIEQKVKQFKKEIGSGIVDYEKLCKAVEARGYTIIEFNNIYNDEEVQNLIDALELSEMTMRTRGLTYVDNNYRLVFIHEDLTEQEKLIVLAHEAGHICLEHLKNTSTIGKDVQEEYETNEFVHFLLKQNWFAKCMRGMGQYKKAIVGVSIALVVIIVGVGVVTFLKESQKTYNNYYITTTGDKYHEKECIFIKDKEDVHQMTEEEYESGEYKPCGICLPEDEK